jgi:oligosaccharide repeat unit polymerase
MSAATLVLIFCWCIAAWHLKRGITLHISVSALLFGALLLIHGVPLITYLYVSGPGTDIYEAALARLNRDEVIDRLQLAVALTYLFITLGSLSAQGLFPRWAEQYKQFSTSGRIGKQMRHVLINNPTTTLFFVLVIIILLAVAVLESQPSKILGFYSSPLSDYDKAIVRNKTGGSAFYLYNVFVSSLGTFVAMVAFMSWKLERGKHGVGLLAVALFGLLWIAKLASLMKAPPVMFLLQYLLLYMIISGKRFSPKLIFGTLIVVVILFVAIVKLTFNDLDFASIFDFLYYRMFEIPNEVLLEYFAAIPASLPYEWGEGLFGFLRDENGAASLPTYYAVAQLTRGNLESSSNAMFIADAWAQFSWLGVALFSYLAGLISRTVDLYAFGRGFTDESAIIVAACSYGVLTLLVTALPTALITGGLALIPLLSLFVSGRAGHVFARLKSKDASATGESLG